MFVAERATNIIRRSTYGGSSAISHVKKFETNLFCPKASLFFPFALVYIPLPFSGAQAKGK
jgi:hypothetical protein